MLSNKTKIGEVMRKKREQLKFSQKEMAEKLNMSESNYSKYESNKINLSTDLAIKIAKVLEMDIRDLIPEFGTVIFENNQIEYVQTGLNSVIKVASNIEYERKLHAQICENYERQIKELKQKLNMQ